jgi:uncharacterized protein
MMTPQERTMLSDLIARVENTRLTEKDPEAEELLKQRLGQNPDALYILAQTVLVQNYALEQARAQIDQLKRQAASAATQPQPAKTTSFLGSLFGHKDEPQAQAQPQPQAQPRPQPPASPAYAPVQQQSYPPPAAVGYPPAYGAPQSYPPPAAQGAPAVPGGGGSSFLRTAATTAAGVAAGALAFEGIESLMHGFGHSAGFGGGGGFMGEPGIGGQPQETVINNYYDSPPGGGDRGDSAGFDTTGAQSGDARLEDAQYTSQQGSADLTPQSDLADDVNVDGGNAAAEPMDVADANLDDGSDDDASLMDDGGLGGGFDDGGFDDGGGDDSSFG